MGEMKGEIVIPTIGEIEYRVDTDVYVQVIDTEDLRSVHGTVFSPREVRFGLENGVLAPGGICVVYGKIRQDGGVTSDWSGRQYRRTDGEWDEGTPAWLRGIVAAAEDHARARGWEGKA